MEYKDSKKKVKKTLKEGRFKHTLGVVDTAVHLAEVHGCDVEKCRLAALLHDCAKHISTEEKLALCREYGVEVTDSEIKNPSLLHAKCGAILAARDYEVEDEDILHAITVHTTGVPEMNMMDKIIFIADYIEPNRDKAPHLKELRQEAETDLDLTCFHILEDTIAYLSQWQAESMDPTTLSAYKYYKERRTQS